MSYTKQTLQYTRRENENVVEDASFVSRDGAFVGLGGGMSDQVFVFCLIVAVSLPNTFRKFIAWKWVSQCKYWKWWINRSSSIRLCVNSCGYERNKKNSRFARLHHSIYNSWHGKSFDGVNEPNITAIWRIDLLSSSIQFVFFLFGNFCWLVFLFTPKCLKHTKKIASSFEHNACIVGYRISCFVKRTKWMSTRFWCSTATEKELNSNQGKLRFCFMFLFLSLAIDWMWLWQMKLSKNFVCAFAIAATLHCKPHTNGCWGLVRRTDSFDFVCWLRKTASNSQFMHIYSCGLVENHRHRYLLLYWFDSSKVLSFQSISSRETITNSFITQNSKRIFLNEC